MSQAALAFAQAPRAEPTKGRPPTAETQVAPVEVSKVRAILADDRRDAGEQRTEGAPSAPLQTASYTIPLGVQIRRLGRGRLRAALALSAALMAGVAGLGALALRGLRGDAGGADRAAEAAAGDARGTHGALAAAPAVNEAVQDETLRAEPRAPAAVLEIVPEDLSAPEEDPALPQSPGGRVRSGELHHRFVRADALLRHPGERAAREARTLLESALPHAPRDAHGYAALATACHRLGDAQCAEEAIDHALSLRPKRSRYVALGQLIRDDLAARP